MSTTKDVLKSKSKRRELEKRDSPYWVQIVRGTSLGYNSLGGTWSVRKYHRGKYESEKLGASDDHEGGITFYEASRLAVRHNFTSKSPKLSLAWKNYERYLVTHGKHIQSASAFYKLHIGPQLGHLELSKLTLSLLEDWKHELLLRLTNPDVKIRRDSANRIITVLKAMLNRAYQEGLVGSDAAWRRLKRFQGVGRARVRVLSDAEISTVLTHSQPAFKALFLAALYTGGRYSELARLMPEDFDGHGVHIRESKSGKPRYVPLTEEGKEFFRKTELPLLTTTGVLWTTNTTQKYVLRIERETGVSFRMHNLRHTYATRLLNNGAHPSVVSKLLGHSGTKMVEKHYGHLFEKTIRENVERYFGSIPGGGADA